MIAVVVSASSGLGDLTGDGHEELLHHLNPQAAVAGPPELLDQRPRLIDHVVHLRRMPAREFELSWILCARLREVTIHDPAGPYGAPGKAHHQSHQPNSERNDRGPWCHRDRRASWGNAHSAPPPATELDSPVPRN